MTWYNEKNLGWLQMVELTRLGKAEGRQVDSLYAPLS